MFSLYVCIWVLDNKDVAWNKEERKTTVLIFMREECGVPILEHLTLLQKEMLKS